MSKLDLTTRVKFHNKSLETAYSYVQSGIFRIDADGSIWKCKRRFYDKWKKSWRLIPTIPKRAEHKVRSGYLRVQIREDRKLHNVAAHRLVFRHVNGPIPEGLTINHRDGCRTNNRPNNLELATYRQQVLHSIAVLKTHRNPLHPLGEKNPAAKFSTARVVEIRERHKRGEGVSHLARALKMSPQTVWRIAHMKSRVLG